VIPDVASRTGVQHRTQVQHRPVARAANLPTAAARDALQPHPRGLLAAGRIGLELPAADRAGPGAVAADSRKPTNVSSLTGQFADADGPAAYDSTYAGAVVATDPLSANGCLEPPAPPALDGPAASPTPRSSPRWGASASASARHRP